MAMTSQFNESSRDENGLDLNDNEGEGELATLMKKADLNLQAGNYKEAVQCYKTAMQTNNNNSDTNERPGPGAAVVLTKLGLAAESAGNYDDAVEYLEESLDTLKDIHGEDEPQTDILNVLDSLSKVCKKSEHPKMAIAYLQELLRLTRVLHNDGPTSQIAELYNRLGVAWQQEDPDKSVKYHYSALAVYNKIYDDGNIDDDALINTYRYLGDAWQQYGDFYKMGAYYKEVYELQKKKSGPNTPSEEMVESLIKLACACKAVGNVDIEKGCFGDILDIQRKLYGDDVDNERVRKAQKRLREIENSTTLSHLRCDTQNKST
uniref:Uncharacterized protein LOC102808276 n=1 Tax=Saccoglossus kowalevskii TaxID=10224 RepID=A0ABM0MI12_SACKO|nr:PREDICTED: uncharacterized protein LOC102808276 [Saccoglossus kowalevskii]